MSQQLRAGGVSTWKRSRRPITAAIAILATTAALAACAPSSGGSASTDCKPADGPVTLNYWTWGAGYSDAADLWNKENPDIQVKFSEVPAGNQGGYQKMFNAVKAGTPPDVGFLEFDTIPSFRSQDAIIDIASCLKDVDTKDFVPGIWSQSTLGDPSTVWSVPIGSGPMALYYRADLLAKFGLTVPTTWDEFAADAIKVHEADPTVYLANFPYGNGNWFAGMAAQAGAQWFTTDSSSWSVDINDAATKKVTDMWSDLINKGAVSTLADFSPEWSAAFANGTLLTWPSAVWGAGVIKSNAPDEAGDWAVAQLPNWDASKPTSSVWGGGGLSVLKGTKYPYEAAKFAYWMGTDPGALKILNKAIGIYPTTNALLANSLFTEKDPYFGNQPIFDEFSTATDNLPAITWGPQMGDTYAALGDAFAAASSGSPVDLSSSLKQVQSAVVDGLKKDGITVK